MADKKIMKNKILVLVNKYPNDYERNICVFIQQLIWQFADLGYDCSVISPLAVNLNIRYFNLTEVTYEYTENNKRITVYRPKYFSLGQGDGPFQKNRVSFTTNSYENIVRATIGKYSINFDFIYSHFLCPSGVVAARLGKIYNVPSFMAHGEALYAGDEKYGNSVLKKELLNLTGVIAVSSQNRDFLVHAGVINQEIVGVFPNGFRKERFHQIDKCFCRKYFRFPEDAFIVGIVGSFDDRKGIFRLEQACDRLENVYFVCAGSGEQIPRSKKCLFASSVDHSDLPFFYNALDVFVLPTLNEGCCNAIVEAIACGCAIISSDRSFNYDICDKSNSILINPNDIQEISDSIQYLKDNPSILKCLCEGSVKKAKLLDLESRAKNILNFIKNKAFES